MPDMVNHPPHYKHASGIETVQVAEQYGFNLGNAFKYLTRYKRKGNPGQDLQKCRWFLNREVDRIRNRPQTNPQLIHAWEHGEEDKDAAFLGILIDSMSRAVTPHQMERFATAAEAIISALEKKLEKP